MFKKCKVVMLPTNEKAHIVLHKYKNILEYVLNQSSVVGETQYFSCQHLYILSDEEIKEDDWYYLPRTNSVYQCKEDPTELNLEMKVGIRKIIATTDKSLTYLHSFGAVSYHDQPYPQPSQSFIEKYVEEYNKGNIITEVMVEYNEMNPTIIGLDQTPQLKINPKDNTITIRKVKDSWSREEVIVKCLKMQHDYHKFCEDSHYPPNMREIAEWTDKWIEENL